MLTAQYAIEVALATRNLPCQTDAALLLLVSDSSDFVHVHELIGSIGALLLRYLIGQRVGIATGNLQGRGSALDNQLEVVVHAFTCQVVGKLMLINGISIARQVYHISGDTVFALHLRVEHQLGARVPQRDTVSIVLRALHHGG